MRGQWTSIVGLAFPLMLFSMFALATGDITPPAWNNTQNNTPATFDAARLLTFITSWTDSSLLDRILFEVNRSGTHTNHTASIFIGNDSFRMNTSSDFLEHDEQLNDVGTTVLTYLDLEALSAGSINNSRGLFLSPQQLTVATNTKVAYTIDPDDATNTPAWYLKFNTESTAYHYKMTFTPSLEADIDNSTDPSPITGLDNATLFILGKNYSIVNTSYTNHTVIINLRDERTNDTIRLADTNITSKELGGQPVVVNNNTITDVVALIDADPYPSFVDFNFFTLNWTADEDIYVPVNSSLSDKDDDNQIFFDFDIWFVGARESESENIWISSVGDDEYVLNFTNKAGNQLNVPLIDEDAGPLRHGNENFDLIIMEGNITTWADAGVIGRNDYFVISDSSAKNTYLLRYRTLDSVENEIEIQEVWSGDEIIIPFNFTNNQTAVANFTLGDNDYDVYIFGDLNNADIIVDLNGNGTMEAGEIPYWYTKYGAYIFVNSVPGNGIKFFSEGGNDTVGATGPTDAITVTFANTTANLVDLSSISGNVTLQTIGGTNDSEDYSIWGTRVSRNGRDGPDLLNLTYPDNQTEMLVYYTTGNIPDAYFVTLSGFPAGTHTWRSIANDTSGNVNSTPWYSFNISRATSTLNLTLNGSSSNLSLNENEFVWINGSLITGDSAAISLYMNGFLINSSTAPANLTNFTTSGTYNVTLTYNPSQNYSASSVTYWVLVNNTLPPTVLSHSPTGIVTSSSTTLTATTNENATCHYSTTANIAYENMSNAMSGNTTSHTMSLSGLTDGTYHYYTRCNNSIGLVATADYDASFTVSIDTGGGSGGGGGGAITTDTTPTVTKVINSVSKEAGIEMAISKETIPVNTIKIEMKESATNVEISVSAIDVKPESVTGPPETPSGTSRTVYKYLEIEHTNLEGKIESATIDFKVTTAWLTDNSYDKKQIILQRYTGSGWEELPTEITRETAANVYYSATTTGFSVFAIAVKEKEQPAKPPVETPVEPPVEPPVELPEEQPIEPPIAPPSKSLFQSTLFTIAVATILGTTGVGYIYRNRLTIGAKIDDLLESLRGKREGRLKTK